MQKTYQSKSGGGYFFAGLLFALVLGGGSYWMLHKEKFSEALTVSSRKPDIAELDASFKSIFSLSFVYDTVRLLSATGVFSDFVLIGVFSAFVLVAVGY